MTSCLCDPVRSATKIIVLGMMIVGMTTSTGCIRNRWVFSKDPVLSENIQKDELVAHLNRNIIGTDNSPGLAGWKTLDAKISLSGVPFPVPATIAVEAPRNLRIAVSHPISGGQEADIGSNHEHFWVWMKQEPKVMTCRHEDVAVASQFMELPIQIEPEWLMEVFGVIPIDASRYTLERSDFNDQVVNLVSVHPTVEGATIERVIRVNRFSGQIDEHLLRDQTGEVIARAMLGKYIEMPNGTTIPVELKFSWPATSAEMKIALGHPEVNPPSFASSHALWQMPRLSGTQVVDVGAIARHTLAQRGEDGGTFSTPRPTQTASSQDGYTRETSPIQPASSVTAQPGTVQLAPTVTLDAPVPFDSPNPQSGALIPVQTPKSRVTSPWGDAEPATRLARPSEPGPPSEYSGEALQLSSDQPPWARE